MSTTTKTTARLASFLATGAQPPVRRNLTPAAAGQAFSQAQLAQLLRAVAPELRSVPLYVVLTSDGAPAEYTIANAWAFTGPALDVTLQSWLESHRRWRGRGVAMLVDDLAIGREVDAVCGDDLQLCRSVKRQWVAAVTLHEAAHAVAERFAERLGEVSQGFKVFARATTAGYCRKESIPLPVPWYGHDAVFLRVLIHLLARSEKYLGHRVPPAIAFDARHYDLSSIFSYQTALAEEPARLAGLPFASIRATDPPHEFIALWQRDSNRPYIEKKEIAA